MKKKTKPEKNNKDIHSVLIWKDMASFDFSFAQCTQTHDEHTHFPWNNQSARRKNLKEPFESPFRHGNVDGVNILRTPFYLLEANGVEFSFFCHWIQFVVPRVRSATQTHTPRERENDSKQNERKALIQLRFVGVCHAKCIGERQAKNCDKRKTAYTLSNDK